MSRQEVQSFFEDYRAKFNRLDGDAVADVWHTPSAITHRAKGVNHAALTTWVDDAPMRANMRSLCDVYRNDGYDHADFTLDSCAPMGEHHAFAVVSWTLTRKDGSLLQQFKTGYNLMRTADGPKVILVTQFEENTEEMKRHAAH
jgi:hypothetical protein